MRYFWDFIDFIIMQELKQPDTIVRNYSIEMDRRGRPIYPDLKNDFVRLGLNLMGLDVQADKVHMAWSELVAELRNVQCYIDEVFIMAYVAQFYIYHRIKTGELRQWKKRTVKS